MKTANITLYDRKRTVFLTEGTTLPNGTKLAGVFLSEEAARLGDGHEEAIIHWNQLCEEHQEIAIANSEEISE